ncbi:hypothetical protein Tco_1117234 [Tanacetum coccineum]
MNSPYALVPIVRIDSPLEQRIRRDGKVKEMFIHYREKKEMRWEEYVPKVYMHQFWDSIHKYDTSYRFRMDKKKKFNLNLEIFKDIFQICPRVHDQNFDELPIDEDIVSFFKELGHTGEIKSITDVVVDQMHQPWRTFATIINRSVSGKTIGLDKLHLSRAQIL